MKFFLAEVHLYVYGFTIKLRIIMALRKMKYQKSLIVERTIRAIVLCDSESGCAKICKSDVPFYFVIFYFTYQLGVITHSYEISEK